MYPAIREAECNSQVTKHLHFGLPFLQSQRDAHRLINEHGLSGRCTVLDGRREEGDGGRECERASQSLKPGRNYSSCTGGEAGRAGSAAPRAAATVIIWAILF